VFGIGGETKARNDIFRDYTPVMLQVLKSDEGGVEREAKRSEYQNLANYSI